MDVPRGQPITLTLYVTVAGVLTDLDALPTTRILDPDGNQQTAGVGVHEGVGRYQFTYTVATDAVTGAWEIDWAGLFRTLPVASFEKFNVTTNPPPPDDGAGLVVTVVTGSWASPDPTLTPYGTVLFDLETDLVFGGAPTVSPRHTEATLVAGMIAVGLTANDSLDASPTNSQYRVTERILGAPESSYWITVPTQPAGSRTIIDGHTTVGSNVLTSVTAAFSSDDAGLIVSSHQFPVGVTIVSVTNTTTAVMSSPALTASVASECVLGASVDLSVLRPT